MSVSQSVSFQQSTKMKTSLLILCASFAMAASTAPTPQSLLEEYQAQDESLSLVIVCEKPVELFFAFVRYDHEEIQSAFIEDHKICTTHRFDDGPDIKVRSNVSLLDKLSMTCTWFSVHVPAYKNEDSPTVVCLKE